MKVSGTFQLNGISFLRVQSANPTGNQYGKVMYITMGGISFSNWHIFAAKHLGCNFDTDFSAAALLVEVELVAETEVAVLVQDSAAVAPILVDTNATPTVEVAKENKKIDRRAIFHNAWATAKSKGISFALALTQAWGLYKNPILGVIATATVASPVTFTFIKENGDTREATTTGVFLSTLKKGFIRYLEVIQGKEAMRCFRIERLISVS